MGRPFGWGCALGLLISCGGGGGGSNSGGASGTPTPLAYGPATVTGTIQAPELTEASGLAASSSQAGVLWSHNDSGDSARVFAFSPAGNLLGTFALTGATAVDIEDLALGPGPVSGVAYLHLADTGDNGLSRTSVTVFRVPEPQVPTGPPPVVAAVGGADAFTLTYPFGPRNTEAFAVDPATGDFILVTRDSSGVSEIYLAPSPRTPSDPILLSRAGMLTFGTAALPGSPTVTGAAISSSGGLIALRTYDHLFVWQRPSGLSVPGALARPPAAAIAHQEVQGEALSFHADGQGLWTVSEGAMAPIYAFRQSR